MLINGGLNEKATIVMLTHFQVTVSSSPSTFSIAVMQFPKWQNFIPVKSKQSLHGISLDIWKHAKLAFLESLTGKFKYAEEKRQAILPNISNTVSLFRND